MLTYCNRIIHKLKLDDLNTRLNMVFILNIFDLLATTLWIQLFGSEVEGNPLARIMFENNSIYFAKTIGVALCVIFLRKVIPTHKKYEWLTWVIFVVYAALAVYHLFLGFRLLMIFGFLPF